MQNMVYNWFALWRRSANPSAPTKWCSKYSMLTRRRVDSK